MQQETGTAISKCVHIFICGRPLPLFFVFIPSLGLLGTLSNWIGNGRYNLEAHTGGIGMDWEIWPWRRHILVKYQPTTPPGRTTGKHRQKYQRTRVLVSTIRLPYDSRSNHGEVRKLYS